MSLVSSSLWIGRGLAKKLPDKAKYSPAEYQRIVGVDNKKCAPKEAPSSEEEGEDEYNFKDYDKEDEEEEFDPNLHLNAGDDSLSEDEEINENDNLVIAGCFENEMELLKVYVYNEVDNDFYVHHDILLTSGPLSLEYIRSSVPPNNVVAVGEMNTTIELWDLDLVNSLKPIAVLGKGKRKKRLKKVCHKGPVVDLAWNKHYPHILASGSADQKVLLWDLTTCKEKTELTKFEGEVECMKWHMHEGQTLVVASADKSLRVFDCRFENTYKSWSCPEKVLCAQWSPWNPFEIICGTSVGNLICIDCRQEKPIWEISSGHPCEITGISLAEECPGLLTCASVDGAIQLWDVKTSHSLVFEKTVNVGKLCTFSTNPDAPYIACVGGDKKTQNFKLVNLKDLDGLAQHWSSEDTSKV